ncbi:putative membrane protein [Wickerhamomyces ciferrii]|uniref:Membrane protein n=1 Tax=Wickerhamomyces ciferrii (strain ATCC 14091 / BCRC 22168 / CBS 111 / JCM 3599 / NBRC 0793 / NRRL Y-1031 F-60-10) TaxID=1206466 RepID=K0KEP8_WICCF|nr:uncharacterized protein BN7_942 [Wickerhamomyces ciferrii]CCH41401.1 putative membrane protein [Wickerhamomyces ciferrii]
MINFNKISLLFPLVLTILTTIFSALTLFQNKNDSYLNIDLSNVKLDYVYSFSNSANNDTLTLWQNTTLAESYSFGLWGYCPNEDSDRFIMNNYCSPAKLNFYPNIKELLANHAIIQGGQYFTAKSTPALDGHYPKSINHQATNGILASFILSSIEFFAILIGLITISFILKFRGTYLRIIILSIITIISLAQWISITIGMAAFKKLSSSMLSLLKNSYDVLGIKGTELNSPVFRYGWVSLALGLVNLLYLVSYLTLEILELSKLNPTKEASKEEVDNENNEEHNSSLNSTKASLA